MWRAEQLKPTRAGAACGPDRPRVKRDRLRQVGDQHVDLTWRPIRGVQCVKWQGGVRADVLHQSILNHPDRPPSPTVGGFGLRDHLRCHPRPHLPYIDARRLDGISDGRVCEQHGPSEGTLDVGTLGSVAARCRTRHHLYDYGNCAMSRAAENVVQSIVENGRRQSQLRSKKSRSKRRPPHQARNPR